MPTVLPRHMITETPEIAAWLDDASRVWPDAANRVALIKHLLEAGHQHIGGPVDDAVSRRRQAIEAASGSMPDVWPQNWYDQYKRDEWS